MTSSVIYLTQTCNIINLTISADGPELLFIQSFQMKPCLEAYS